MYLKWEFILEIFFDFSKQQERWQAKEFFPYLFWHFSKIFVAFADKFGLVNSGSALLQCSNVVPDDGVTESPETGRDTVRV